MKHIRELLIILVFVNCFGCSNGDVQKGYDSPKELAAAYQHYHDTRDINGLLSLVYSSPDDKKIHLSSFNDDMQLIVTNIAVEELETGALDAWKKRGIVPNITPVGWLKVSLKRSGKNDPTLTSYSQYLIGTVKSRYFIATNK